MSNKFSESQADQFQSPLNHPSRTPVSRLRTSIADSIVKQTQVISPSVFTSQSNIRQPSSTNDELKKKKINNPPQNSNHQASNSAFQLPFSISQLTAAGLAMATGNLMPNQHHDHDQHHHMDHSSPTLEPDSMRRCPMNMVFNSQPMGTCIVFRQFYVSGPVALLFYLTLLFFLAIGYEYLRLASQKFDKVIQVKLSGLSKRASPRSTPRVSSTDNLLDNSNPSSPHSKLAGWGQITVPRSIQLTRSLFYISNVTLSFFLMLVIMTYNAQIILAVLAGAFVGHFIFHREISTGEADKGMACH